MVVLPECALGGYMAGGDGIALDGPEIAGYLASGEWAGKAGAYAIQGRAGGFVPWIGGSYSNVVGLPLTETLGLLAAAGVVPAP